MLARSGKLPTSGDYAYELKWDGFRAIISTEGPLRVRSRRGWDMTEHLGFLAELPVRVVLDGELVALDEEGKPDFPELCGARADEAPLDSSDLHGLRRAERRRRGGGLAPVLGAAKHPRGHAAERRPLAHARGFDDGEALWTAVVEHELEGVVAKRRSGRYLPGRRAWIKTKNKEYWRYELERESAINRHRGRAFV
jgi:bifunctional non-homologous end joining protein LigD